MRSRSRAAPGGLAGPETRLADLPGDFGGYGPDDFTHHFMGMVSAATALRRSLDLPAERACQQRGRPGGGGLPGKRGFPLHAMVARS
ncbi:MAG: hypothetical protein M0002_14960 [Rhodospirillales bacterium]|nr:hypothetical protein [Rhodospirillales bacterium]